MNDKFLNLWETKNKNDEWWSSFVTSPLAILFNYFIVDIKWLTPNRITTVSFIVALLASAFILIGSQPAFIAAAIFINLSHILDCMDGQMAKYRGVSSRFGNYFDKVTDQLTIFLWFGAIAYASFVQTDSITPVFLAFTGVTFYSLRVYVKYVTIFIEVEHDVNYLEKSSQEAASINQQRRKVGGIEHSFKQNVIWFLGEQRKLFLFNEAVFVFMLSVALVFNVILPVLWIFAISQLYYGLVRSWQRGSQIYNDQHSELIKPMEK
ncbi:MAG: CDP-alcohol phosphatidyltransferase family protein [Candidatus Hydrogenedentota bacterium]